jgi:hypothetical protein
LEISTVESVDLLDAATGYGGLISHRILLGQRGDCLPPKTSIFFKEALDFELEAIPQIAGDQGLASFPPRPSTSSGVLERAVSVRERRFRGFNDVARLCCLHDKDDGDVGRLDKFS